MTTDKFTLAPYDGKDVLGQSIKITNAGDGLSSALAVEPREFHIGDKVYVVLETEVAALGPYKPVKDTDALRMEVTLRAGAATIVERSLVAGMLDEQRRLIEEAAGVQRLFDEQEAEKAEREKAEADDAADGLDPLPA